jgi:hypothetical protein
MAGRTESQYAGRDVGPAFTTPSSYTLLPTIILILSIACGGSTTSPTAPTQSSNPSLHGEVTDPSGDALGDARLATSPDLVRATADVSAGSITFTARVAPGTFAQATTRFTILLNTDQNVATGTGTLGIEYFVQMGGILANRADIVRSDGDVVVGSVPVSFVANGIDAIVPLALIGNDDGRLNFKVFASAGPVWPDVLDRMPDEGLPPGRVQ